jgi:lipoyl(octanoyl) transferase
MHGMPAASTQLWIARLGLVEYDAALELQHHLHAARVAGEIADTLLLLEHPPVYTRGRRSSEDELPMGEEWYRQRGIALRDVDRGGKVTYHGPGQLVGYPIVSTALSGGDVPALVGLLEQSMIDALAAEGVAARRSEAGRGVWAGCGEAAGKIGSIGLHIAADVTTHGVMVNVENDLTPFTWIRPCGLDEPVTSIARVSGARGRMDAFADHLAVAVGENFGLHRRPVTSEFLQQRAAAIGLAA